MIYVCVRLRVMSDTITGAVHRVHVVDAVRGLALCGILLTNIPQLADLIGFTESREYLPIPYALELVAHQRFYPIFAFLFGLSFALFLDGAATRTAHPRLVLLRRMAALAVIGFAHHQLQPGEALLPYAVIGVIVLLPASLLPTRVLVPLALAATAGAVVLGSPSPLIGALFLLGLATTRSGIVHTLDRRGKQIAVLFAVSVAGSSAALWWQLGDMVNSGFSTSSAVAGFAMAVSFTTGLLLLLLRTRAGRPLAAVLEPLGRMALTNYLTATLMIIAVVGSLDVDSTRQWGFVLPLAAAVIAVQVVFSRWWLRRFRYGPAEWCWRCVTWWSGVPNRFRTTTPR